MTARNMIFKCIIIFILFQVFIALLTFNIVVTEEVNYNDTYEDYEITTPSAALYIVDDAESREYYNVLDGEVLCKAYVAVNYTGSTVTTNSLYNRINYSYSDRSGDESTSFMHSYEFDDKLIREEQILAPNSESVVVKYFLLPKNAVDISIAGTSYGDVDIYISNYTEFEEEFGALS